MTSESPQVRAPALEMRGITKRYPGVVANDSIDLDIRPGEIHALLGENGAGKTTLMNILYGLARPDEGQILIDGTEVDLTGPSDAIRRGISMVHQHFMLVPVLTVAENIVLGEETTVRGGFLDRKEAHKRIIELGRRFGFEVDPEVKVGSLSVGWQQRVEILKALYRDAKILVLDEPTAVLTPQETEEIFEVLRRLAAEGHSIVFISHKLYEVLEIADRITVIRRGKVVGQRIPSETNEEDLAELMVGREVSLTVDRGESHPAGGDPQGQRADGPRRPRQRGRPRHRPRGPRGRDPRHRRRRRQRPGRARRGDRRAAQADRGGTVTLDGTDITGLKSRDVYEHGVGYVPADRHRFGLVLSFSIADNLVLTSYHRPAVLARAAAQRRRHPRSRRGADQGLRHPDAVGGGEGLDPVRRQPAEGRHRPRVQPRPAPARPRPADPRPRRRQHRVHPQADHRQARRGSGDPARLRRARRDPRAVRPDRGHLPRPAGRAARRADRRQERRRPADGHRRPAGDDGTARVRRRRGAQRRDRERGMSDRSEPRLGHPRAAADLDRPVGHRRLAGHHLLAVAGHRRAAAGPRARRLRRARVRLDRLGAGDRQHAQQHDAAAARRPRRRPRLQGRPVQHRRPGPVPDGRPRLGHRRRPAAREPGRSSPSPSRCWPG